MVSAFKIAAYMLFFIIIILGGMYAYSGIFSGVGDRFEKCVFNMGFHCEKFSIYNQVLNVTMISNIEYNIKIDSSQIKTSNNCLSSELMDESGKSLQSIQLWTGDKFYFKALCPDTKYQKINVTIAYTNVDSGLESDIAGVIIVKPKVENQNK